jgi:hypothetical protein
MKYIFCTIAIGEKYLNSALEFATNLNSISDSHKMLIVTDLNISDIENCFFVKINEEQKTFIHNYFNYNLKYLPIKESLKLDFEYIFYVDADWQIYSGYSETKILNFIDYMSSSNLDFIFERPHLIGASKRELHNCFWRHKIEPYRLMETDFYDNGHVCNEQFLAFRNSDKLKIFCDEWEKRNNFGVENSIWAFAEGLEIGMSSIDANLNYSYNGLHFLNSCFRFETIYGIEYIRF